MKISGLVSVVIPTYNRATTIERAVDSVLSQEYPHLEVIVVDDGSSDDTADRMIRRYSSDRRVRYLRFPNGGVCVARNRGLKEVRGEFVAMLDSDDYWLPEKISLQVSILASHSELSLVWSDMDAVDTCGRVVSHRYLRQMYGCYRHFPDPLDLFARKLSTAKGIVYYIGQISHALVLGNLVHTSTVLARTDHIRLAGEYDQSVHPSEDQDFYYRLSKTGPVALVDEVTTHYQIGADDAASGIGRNYELAKSSLEVFRRLSKVEGAGPRLPKRKIAMAEKEFYAWVGAASLQRGETGEARRYLARRVLHCPSDTRSLAYLAMACLPRLYAVTPHLLAFLRNVRHR